MLSPRSLVLFSREREREKQAGAQGEVARGVQQKGFAQVVQACTVETATKSTGQY